MIPTRYSITAALAVLLATSAFAQPHVEVGATVGHTLSSGVPVNATADGVTYTSVDPVSSKSFGLTFGIYVSPHAEVEFLWNRQPTKLQVSGIGAALTGDMNVDVYHANFVYNFGDFDDTLSPFAFIGIGATNYGDAKFSGTTVSGMSRFSWGLGGGVKAYPSRHVGFKGQVAWTPTYIRTDAVGWWCHPYWGCRAMGNARFAQQLEMSAGVLLRF